MPFSYHHSTPIYCFCFSWDVQALLGFLIYLQNHQVGHLWFITQIWQKFAEFSLLLVFLLWITWEIPIIWISRTGFKKVFNSITIPEGSSTRTFTLSTLETSLKHLFLAGHCPKQTRNTANNILWNRLLKHSYKKGSCFLFNGKIVCRRRSKHQG